MKTGDSPEVFFVETGDFPGVFGEMMGLGEVVLDVGGEGVGGVGSIEAVLEDSVEDLCDLVGSEERDGVLGDGSGEFVIRDDRHRDIIRMHVAVFGESDDAVVESLDWQVGNMCGVDEA